MKYLAFLALAALLAAPSALAQEPNWQGSPLYGRVDLASGFTPDPHSVQVTAGGTTPNPINGPGCVGYIAASQPDYNVFYDAGSTFDLTIYAESDRDTALLIYTPDRQWVCDDDSGDGLDPSITFTNPLSGSYNVWVATYGEDTASATLYVSELGNPGVDGGDFENEGPFVDTEPCYSCTPTNGEITLDEGFSPDPFAETFSLYTPDANPIQGAGCRGYINLGGPDFRLYYDAGTTFPLAMYAEGDRDLVMLVNLPDGTWVCDDDSGEGVNPLIELSDPPTGQYDIWVGSYGSGGTGSTATLFITELEPPRD